MDVREKRFPIVEVFGPTIQGEGPEVGTRAHFIRFGGCDFRCAWCDSAPAVLPEEVRLARKMTATEIVNKVNALPFAPLVILSGGNPLLQEAGEIVDWLHDAGFNVSVETQGTLWKEWINKVDQVVVSPKPPSAGMPHSTRMLKGFLDRTYRPVVLKIPCDTDEDVAWAAEVAAQFAGYPMFLSIVTRMGGLSGTYADGVIDTTGDVLERYRHVVEESFKHPTLVTARIIPQMHVLLWGHERGH